MCDSRMSGLLVEGHSVYVSSPGNVWTSMDWEYKYLSTQASPCGPVPSAPSETEVYNTTYNRPAKNLELVLEKTAFGKISDIKFDNSGRHILVVSDDQRPICRYDYAGALLCAFGHSSGPGCGAICCDSRRQVVVCARGNVLARMTRYGQKASGMPFGVYLHVEKARICTSLCYLQSQDKYIVNDLEQNSIFVVDAKSEEVTHIGRKSSKSKSFQRPVCVSANLVASRPVLAVSDSLNHCVKLFSLKGKLRCENGCYGDGPGQLIRPEGLCLDREGRVVVCDYSNKRVVRFTPQKGTARWECVISPEQLGYRHPARVDISNDGHVVVSTVTTEHSLCAWTLFRGYS